MSATDLEPCCVWGDPGAPCAAHAAEAITGSETVMPEIPPPPGDEHAPPPAANGHRPGPGALPPPHEQPGRPPAEASPPPTVDVVTVEDFAAIEEPGADALLGRPDEILIPANGDIMLYGDGGAGKTTLTIDMATHLAAGDDWLGITVGRPLTVLMVENEGPRPLFRTKLRAKLSAWTGSPLAGRLRIVETPWASLTFADEGHRQALADAIAANATDLLIIGPVTRSGMTEAGTLEEVRRFTDLLADVRRRAGRPVSVLLVHHENKANGVSGAWEGATDTLLHLTGQGHGKTRLYIQKARWSAAHHATTMQLLWADGASFTVDDKPELDDDQLAENIFAVISDDPGIGWTRVEELTPGANRQRRREVRDQLLSRGEIVNVAKIEGAEVLLDHCPERKAARLFVAADPTIEHLRPEPGAVGAQLDFAGGEGVVASTAPCAPPRKGRRGVGAAAPPGLDHEAEQ